jgi:hypothetical protein
MRQPCDVRAHIGRVVKLALVRCRAVIHACACADGCDRHERRHAVLKDGRLLLYFPMRFFFAVTWAGITAIRVLRPRHGHARGAQSNAACRANSLVTD